MAHYYAIADRGQGRTWWISVPNGPGIYSAAGDAGEIVAQAQGALASAVMHPGGEPPCSIEDGARPTTDLSDFEQPAMVVVIPFEAEAEAREAA